MDRRTIPLIPLWRMHLMLIAKHMPDAFWMPSGIPDQDVRMFVDQFRIRARRPNYRAQIDSTDRAQRS